MTGENLLYDDHELSDFNLIMVASESAPSLIGREIERGDISAVRSVPNYLSVKYSDVLELNFTFIKNPCYETDDRENLDDFEINLIRSWLESPKVPTELHVSKQDDKLNIFYYGLFTDVQPYLINQECYGINATFTCNAPYGFSKNKKTFSFNNSLKIEDNYLNPSAEKYEYLNPQIVITANTTFNGETIEIINHNDNENNMKIILPKGKSQIYIDCDKKLITDENNNMLTLSDIGVSLDNLSEYNLLSTSTLSFNWLKFVYGVNALQFNQSSDAIKSVTITTKYPVKTGGC
jgi:hypothetical protein